MAIPFFEERMRDVKPGITGLAQVNLSYTGKPHPDTLIAKFEPDLTNPFKMEGTEDSLADHMRIKLLYDLAYCAAMEDMSTFLRTELGKLQTRNRSDVQRDREHATRSGAQRTERVATFFFGRDVFEVPLLLLDAHVAEPHRALELCTDALAEIRQRECFDVDRVSAWELWLGFLVFAILFERDRAILGDDELRAVLESFEFAGDAPETGFQPFLCFEYFAPDLQSEGAGGVARRGVAEETALLRAALADGGDEHHQPEIFAVGNFRDGDVTAQAF